MENNQTKNDRQLRHREMTYKSRLSFVDPLESKKLRVSIVPLVTKKFSMNDGTTMLEDQARHGDSSQATAVHDEIP